MGSERIEDTGAIYDSSGNQVGVAADLGSGPFGEWWAIASGTITSSPAPKVIANAYLSGALTVQLSGKAQGFGEQSTGTIVVAGLTVAITTAAVPTIDINPAAKISIDWAKGELVANKLYLGKARLTVSDVEGRQQLASAKATLKREKKNLVKLKKAAASLTIAQVEQS